MKRLSVIGKGTPARILAIAYFGLFFTFIFAPFVLVIAFAFNEGRFPRLPWQGFTIHWFSVLADSTALSAMTNSLGVGVASAMIATPLGVLAAYFATRWDFKSKNAYLAIVLAPPCIPLIVLALCFTIYFRQLNIPKSLTSVAIGHAVLTAPFVFAIVRLRLHAIDRTLEMAAWNLGANEWASFRTIILPQLSITIVASFLLAFAVSWDEFIVAWFLSALDVTLPVYLWTTFQSQVSASVNALGTICFMVSVTLLILIELLTTHTESRGGSKDL